MKTTRRQQGFTLLEIMIALTIFAVISTLAWQILDGAMRTSAATDASAAKLNQLQRAWNLLERDFFQLQGVAPRNGSGTFFVKDNALEMTTLNGVSGQVQLERVRWRLAGNRLWRDVWPFFDGPASTKPDEVPIVNEVKSLQWRFWQSGWQKAWHDSDHQPDGVELTLTMLSGERWRWVFTTPGDLPQEVEKPKDASADKPTEVPADAATSESAQTAPPAPETPSAAETQP
ncbi:type II secretion system minor pseudopilin GspJ [Leclercia adecarboxylata]|uniref:type II secretion system minor pseudopilin GspJ n=1 Tax=Leclercia adecarboxylata TaxID=83655 RepID=UPI002DB89A92|nr:type II secretion system minor pseudopilin GspJ [Leclercia adecarboxylata]MEB6379135.1 type II secretion system minor pseudopilin GspJ [Leclercia adecarboxylata]